MAENKTAKGTKKGSKKLSSKGFRAGGPDVIRSESGQKKKKTSSKKSLRGG